MKPEKGQQPDSHDLKHFHGEAAASSIENAGAAYQAPSLIAAGASAQEVAFLSILTNLLFSIVLIKIPSILDARRSLKRIVMIFSFLNIISWIPLIIVLFFFGKVAPVWLIVLWFVSLIPIQLTGPLRDNWLAERLPVRTMGRYLSLRSALSGFIFISAFYVMGYILSVSGGQIFKGYAIVLFLSFTGAVACFILFKGIRQPKNEANSPTAETFNFMAFLKAARHGALGKFILYVSMVSFSVCLCSAFFSVYMLRDLQFGYMAYAIVVSSEFLARIVSLAFWGKLVDRSGSMKLMKISSMFIPFIPVLWLFSSNVAYLVMVQLLSGTVWAAFDLSNQTFVYKEAPHEKRLRYIVYQKSLTTFAMALGGLVGALVIPFMLPIFGNQILGLFLVSGILRLVVVISMYPRQSKSINEIVNEPAVSEKTPRQRTPVYVSPRLGLYYQPERWVKEPVIPEPRFITVTSATDILMPKGAYYRPNEWPEYIKPAKKMAAEKIIPPGRGIYYQPAEWQEFIRQTSVCHTPVCLSDLERVMQQPLHVVRPPKIKTPVTALA